MEPPASAAAPALQEEAAYLRYDRRRREQLLQLLAPLLASIFTLGSALLTAVLITNVLPKGGVRIALCAVLLYAATSWFATLAIWRGRPRLATTLIQRLGTASGPQ